MGKEKSHIPLRVSLKPVLLLNELGVIPIHLLSWHIKYLSFLQKIFYKLQNCYLSDYAYFTDINKHSQHNYGDLWKPMPVIGGTVSRYN